MSKIYDIKIFECQCGYYTHIKTNAQKHSKTVGCKDKIMTSSIKHFTDISEPAIIENTTIKKFEEIINNKEKTIRSQQISMREKDAIIERLQHSIERLSNKTSSHIVDDDDVNIGSGIIYYIVDEDVPSRGKIGRTKNTDIKRLKGRYSTFSKPLVFCFHSDDIKTDENELKKVLKENECMDPDIGKETVKHNSTTMRLFHEFAIRRSGY